MDGNITNAIHTNKKNATNMYANHDDNNAAAGWPTQRKNRKTKHAFKKTPKNTKNVRDEDLGHLRAFVHKERGEIGLAACGGTRSVSFKKCFKKCFKESLCVL